MKHLCDAHGGKAQTDLECNVCVVPFPVQLRRR